VVERREVKGPEFSIPVLLLAFIHPTAWKRNSAKFAYKAFSEVGLEY